MARDRISAAEYRRLVSGAGANDSQRKDFKGRRGRAGAQTELDLAHQLISAGIRGFEREYEFHPERKWRLDFAWPEERLAVEIDGGVHRIKGRFSGDVVKHNELNLMGWVLLRFEPGHVRNGHALDLIQSALAKRRKDGMEG